MEDLPLVSIITIVYNGEKYIRHVIESVIHQTYPNIEYIIVDGGSTDNTLSIIKEYQRSITTFISEKDRGISDAFNKGIQRANGEIIGLINADDWYELTTVEKVVNNFADAGVIYGDLQLWKDGEKDFILKGSHAFIEKEMTINHPTVFVKKKYYNQFGLFDESYRCAMDYDLMLRFSVNNVSFKYIPEVLANMRWAGLSDSQWKLGCMETLAIKNKLLPDKKLQHRLYYYKHVLAIAIPKLLTRYGFAGLIKLYRTAFSRIKKVYN